MTKTLSINQLRTLCIEQLHTQDHQDLPAEERAKAFNDLVAKIRAEAFSAGATAGIGFERSRNRLGDGTQFTFAAMEELTLTNPHNQKVEASWKPAGKSTASSASTSAHPGSQPPQDAPQDATPTAGANAKSSPPAKPPKTTSPNKPND